jgi:hypothetical protein
VVDSGRHAGGTENRQKNSISKMESQASSSSNPRSHPGNQAKELVSGTLQAAVPL